MTVAITGLGVVSPLGHTLDEFWQALLHTDSHPTPLDWVADQPGGHAYRVDPDPEPPPSCPRAGRATRVAAVAVSAALRDAGLSPDDVAGEPVGVCVGTGTGDGDLLERERDGTRRLDGLEWWPYGVSGHIAAALGLTGPTHMVSTACAASAYAVSLGAQMIERGEASMVLAGGAETVSRPAQAAFMRLHAVDDDRCRPFDSERHGTVYGEGAAFLLLEDAEHARLRGRPARANVLGAGWSCDAHHVTAPAADGAQAGAAIDGALLDGDVVADDVVAVLCHGTGTPLNDRVEAMVVARAMAGSGPLVTAIKSKLGHTGGAAGAFSALVGTLIVQHGIVPPIAGLREPDADCTLRLVSGSPAIAATGPVLVNAYAFGGNNISLLIGPCA
jgi:3-oxoacyl-[acyl-carrier-protein] synthase II